MNKNILWLLLGLLVLALIVWFLAAQTEVDGQLNENTAQVQVIADTDYSDDIARVESDFDAALLEVETNIAAGVETTTTQLSETVDNIEAEAQQLGVEAQAAYANFIASARARIEVIDAQLPDVDIEIELNESEDGDSTVSN